ncbi:MAG: hypothetical protein ACLTKE_12230 [Coprococcus sp.]
MNCLLCNRKRVLKTAKKLEEGKTYNSFERQKMEKSEKEKSI